LHIADGVRTYKNSNDLDSILFEKYFYLQVWVFLE